MKRLKKFQPMMIIALFLNLLISCSNDQDEFLENQNTDVEDVLEFVAAVIYYEEQDGDKHAIVYTTDGDKKTFTNGKKVEETKERAPKPVKLPDHVDNPKHSEIIEGDSWTDEEAMDQTTPDASTDSETTTDPETETTPEPDTETTPDAGTTPQELSAELKYWKELFDAEWVEADYRTDRDDAYARSNSKNLNQEYYFLGKYIDGLQQVWQATGDNTYLDTALELIYNTMNDAVDVGGGYKGWPSASGKQVALWDSYYWRHVATILRILHQSPNLRASNATYQQAYTDLLNFSEKHIWERYEVAGLSNFYRSRTHMASHWARIGMELYIVTSNPKYKEVFDNISFGNMVGRPSNLRDRIYNNPNHPDAYVWDQKWEVNHGDYVQDTSHGEAVASFIANAYDAGLYWTRNDVDALGNTLLKVIWPASNGSELYYNIDGSNGYEQSYRNHEWLNLGRYSSEIQNRIKSDYITGTQDDNLHVYGVQAIGIAALNAKILEDGAPVYPEL